MTDIAHTKLEESIKKRGLQAPALFMQGDKIVKCGKVDGEPSPGWFEQMYLDSPQFSNLSMDSEGRVWEVHISPCTGCDMEEVEEELSQSIPEKDSNKEIYFISDGDGSVKIGISVNPEERVSSLQTASKHNLELLYSKKVSNAEEIELKLHQRLSEFQQNGEWFDLPEGKIEELTQEISNE